MWDQPAQLVCVTGNSTIKASGAVVMGRGAALECLNLYPDIALKFGKLIQAYAGEPYGLVTVPVLGSPAAIGLFQVKRHFRDAADLELIKNSVGALAKLVETGFRHDRVFLNFPGTGYGRRNREEVLPLLTPLPDNVEVWEYA